MAFLTKTQAINLVVNQLPVTDNTGMGNNDYPSRTFYGDRLFLMKPTLYRGLRGREFFDLQDLQDAVSGGGILRPITLGQSFINGNTVTVKNTQGYSSPYSILNGTLVASGDSPDGVDPDAGMEITVDTRYRVNSMGVHLYASPWYGSVNRDNMEPYTYAISFYMDTTQMMNYASGLAENPFYSLVEFNTVNDTTTYYCFGFSYSGTPMIRTVRNTTSGVTVQREESAEGAVPGGLLYAYIEIFPRLSTIHYYVWGNDGVVRAIEGYPTYNYLYSPLYVGMTLKAANSSISIPNHFGCFGKMRSFGTHEISNNLPSHTESTTSPILEVYTPWSFSGNFNQAGRYLIVLYDGSTSTINPIKGNYDSFFPVIEENPTPRRGIGITNHLYFNVGQTNTGYLIQDNYFTVDIEFSLENIGVISSTSFTVFEISVYNWAPMGLFISGDYKEFGIGDNNINSASTVTVDEMILGNSYRAHIYFDPVSSGVNMGGYIINIETGTRYTFPTKNISYLTDNYSRLQGLCLGDMNDTFSQTLTNGKILYTYVILGRSSAGASTADTVGYFDGMASKSLTRAYGPSASYNTLFNALYNVDGRYGIINQTSTQLLSYIPNYTSFTDYPTVPIVGNNDYSWGVLYTLNFTNKSNWVSTSEPLFGTYCSVITNVAAYQGALYVILSWTDTTFSLNLQLVYYTDKSFMRSVTLFTGNLSDYPTVIPLYFYFVFRESSSNAYIFDEYGKEFAYADISSLFETYETQDLGNIPGILGILSVPWQGTGGRISPGVYARNILHSLLQGIYYQTNVSANMLINNLEDYSIVRTQIAQYSGNATNSIARDLTLPSSGVNPRSGFLLLIEFTVRTSGMVRIFTLHSQDTQDTPREIQVYGDTSTGDLSIGIINSAGSTIYDTFDGYTINQSHRIIVFYDGTSTRVSQYDKTMRTNSSFTAISRTCNYAYINGEKYYSSGRGQVNYTSLNFYRLT